MSKKRSVAFRKLKIYSLALFILSLVPSLIYLEIVRAIHFIDIIASMLIPSIVLLFIFILFQQFEG